MLLRHNPKAQPGQGCLRRTPAIAAPPQRGQRSCSSWFEHTPSPWFSFTHADAGEATSNHVTHAILRDLPRQRRLGSAVLQQAHAAARHGGAGEQLSLPELKATLRVWLTCGTELLP